MKPALIPLLLCLSAAAFAQGPPPPDGHGPPPGGGWNHDDRGGPPPRPRTSLGVPPGRWWHDPDLIRKLSLAPDQQSRIDDLYQQNRARLSDLSTALRKEQSILEPLLDVEHPDQSLALAQIDRVAQARAELEKANARMLLSFRAVLTLDQWKKLQSDDSRPPRDLRR